MSELDDYINNLYNEYLYKQEEIREYYRLNLSTPLLKLIQRYAEIAKELGLHYLSCREFQKAEEFMSEAKRIYYQQLEFNKLSDMLVQAGKYYIGSRGQAYAALSCWQEAMEYKQMRLRHRLASRQKNYARPSVPR